MKTRLADIIRNADIALEGNLADGSRLAQVTAAAGEGTILAIDPENAKGK